MPLIYVEDQKEEKEAWRIRLRKEVCKEIVDYCEWADIKYKDTFIERACQYIFQHDAEWQARKSHKKTSKERKKAK